MWKKECRFEVDFVHGRRESAVECNSTCYQGLTSALSFSYPLLDFTVTLSILCSGLLKQHIKWSYSLSGRFTPGQSPASIQHDVGWVPDNNAFSLLPLPHTCLWKKQFVFTLYCDSIQDGGFGVRTAVGTIFSPPHLSSWALRPNQPIVQWVPFFVPGVKAAGAWHWPPLHLPNRLKKE